MGYSKDDLEKIAPFLNEGQNPSIVFRYWQIMTQFFAPCIDSCAGFYHQIGILFPEVCMLSTGRRHWLYKKRITGSASFRNYNSALLKKIYIEEYPLWCKVGWTMRKKNELAHIEWTGDPEAVFDHMPRPYHMTMLPKAQARRFFTLLQEDAMFWDEEMRTRALDYHRFKSGTVVMREGSPEIFSEWNDLDSHVKGMADTDPKELPPVSEFEITPELHNRMLAKAEESQDPEILLEYSKQQLEKGLITEQEYLQRKQEMLARI